MRLNRSLLLTGTILPALVLAGSSLARPLDRGVGEPLQLAQLDEPRGGGGRGGPPGAGGAGPRGGGGERGGGGGAERGGGGAERGGGGAERARPAERAAPPAAREAPAAREKPAARPEREERAAPPAAREKPEPKAAPQPKPAPEPKAAPQPKPAERPTPPTQPQRTAPEKPAAPERPAAPAGRPPASSTDEPGRRAPPATQQQTPPGQRRPGETPTPPTTSPSPPNAAQPQRPGTPPPATPASPQQPQGATPAQPNQPNAPVAPNQRPGVPGRPVAPPGTPPAGQPGTPGQPGAAPNQGVQPNQVQPGQRQPGQQPNQLQPGQQPNQMQPGMQQGVQPNAGPGRNDNRPDSNRGDSYQRNDSGRRDVFNAPGRPGYIPGGFRDDDYEGRDYDRVRRDRREYDVDGRTYYREPGRIIVRDRDGYYIRHDENERFRELDRRAYRSERRGQETFSYIDRPGGEQIVTVVDDDGRLVRRYRRYRDGREVYLINNSYGPGGPRPIYDDVVDLPPPDIRIPRDRYVVDYSRADARTVYGALSAAPVMALDRRYSLDQVRYSPQLRARMPSVDIDSITFDSGAFQVTPEQARQLQNIADGLNQAVKANPQEVFLIEGYTDAVGEAVDNLSLSDRRAQSVATVLTQTFNVPPENLTTQGYGEQNLKVNTQEANRENRRVTVRRITPLLQQQADQQNGAPPPQ